ncbi:MAG: ArsR family transcriptional regulator [Promethearchaeota archaeon]
MTLTDILHPTRVKILELLSENPKVLADIAKDLDLSKPEISRHLARMRELNLVETKDRSHQLSNLGEVILNLISPIGFLIENYDFFINHRVDLPFSFIRDIDSLKHSELMAGTGYIASKMEEIRKNTTIEAKMMVDQPFPGSIVQIERAMLIVPFYAKIENLNLDILEKSCKYYEFRTLPFVNLTLGITDRKHGFLIFPERITGKIDYNYAFYITDDLGLDFLSRLWDYYWEKAEFRISTPQQL